MPLLIRLKIFLVLALLVNYIFKISQLIDQFHVSRFAFMTVVTLLGVAFILPKLEKVDFNILDAAVFLFFGINLASLTWAADFSEAIFTAQKTFIFGISYYLFRQILNSKKIKTLFISRVFQILTLIALTLISSELLQVATSQGLDGKAVYKITTQAGHKNLVASFLFLLLGLNIFFHQPKQNKLIFYLLIGWQLLLILLLRSRAVYMSCALFAIIVGGYYALQGTNPRVKLAKKVLPLLGVITIVGAVIITKTNAGGDYAKYLNPLTYFDNASSKERLFVWSKTKDLIKDQPGLGLGAGQWKIFFPSKSIHGGYRLQEKDLVFTRAHNDFLEVFAELGILGLLSYLLIFILGMWAVYQSIKLAKPEAKQKRLVLLALLLGYCIIGFFDFPKERIEHQVMLAMVLATIAWKSQSWLKKQRLYIELNSKQLKGMTLLFTLTLLLHLPTAYYRLTGDYYCTKMFVAKQSEKYSLMQTYAEKAGSHWNAFDPLVIPYRWYIGLGLYMDGKYKESLPHFENSYSKNPYNFNVINNYASNLVQVGNYEKAIPLYLDALRINPKFEDGMFNLAYSYFQKNQFKEALEWTEKTQKNPKKKADFLQIINQAISESK